MTRKQRERAERRQLIVSTAREMAEADGWDAVTTRRLSQRIEYSQPVLYSHFKGKDAIVDAVALEGVAELAAAMRAARGQARRPRTVLTRVAEAYRAFARDNPATYDAIFVLRTNLVFGPGAPTILREAFGELAAAFSSGTDDAETRTEVGWGALHGLVVLERAGRLRPDHADQRLRLLVERFSESD